MIQAVVGALQFILYIAMTISTIVVIVSEIWNTIKEALGWK